MRRPLSIFALLLAWLCAHGALWDVVQVFAWGKMFTGYAQTMTVREALRATFDPAKPCDLCVAVINAQSAEPATTDTPAPASPNERSLEKLLLALHTSSPLVFSPPAPTWWETPSATPPLRTEPVPLPPPRAQA